MSFPITVSAIQPKTGDVLIDFQSGPFAAFTTAKKLSLLHRLLQVYAPYELQNESIVNTINKLIVQYS